MNPQMFLLCRLFSLVGRLVSNSHGINNALVQRNGAAMYYQQVGLVCLGANRFCKVLSAGNYNNWLKVRLLCALNQTCLWALKHSAKLNMAQNQNKENGIC